MSRTMATAKSCFTPTAARLKSRKIPHQDFTAKWDEFRLVAEGKDPRGNKYQRSYEVLEGNQQLRETLFLKVGQKQHGSLHSIRL